MQEIIEKKIKQLEIDLSELRDELDNSEHHFRNLKISKEIEEKQDQLIEIKKTISILKDQNAI